jgi:hypothetical protein
MHNTFTSYRIEEFYFRFLSVVIKDDVWIIAFCGIRAYGYNGKRMTTVQDYITILTMKIHKFHLDT